MYHYRYKTFENREYKKIIEGRLIFKSGDLVGLLTKDGPITLTIPKSYYFKTIKNKIYKPENKDESKNDNRPVEGKDIP